MSATFVNKDGKEVERTRCLIYTRVVGFYNPVSNFNIGKKGEFYTRKYFNEKKSMNSEFSAKYAPAACPCSC
ncbi:MAG: hypothetical protein WCG98_01165 [bacterium]